MHAGTMPSAPERARRPGMPGAGESTEEGDGAALTVSVVVCAYTEQRWDDLRAAVASVAAQTLPALETVVVVDHNPALLDLARRELAGAVVVENAGRRGLSGARNSGVAAAAGDVVAFLDDDAAAAPDWLERLAAAYADPGVLGVGGLVSPAWERGRPRAFPEEFAWVVGCSYRGLPETRAPVRNMIGANMSFRASVFAGVGGFREDVGRVGTRPVGCEETELCIRALARWPEGAVLYEPAATVAHRVPASRAGWRYFRSRCWSEGRSKAVVSRVAGAGAGLSSERAYASRTLPRGVARALAAAARGDLAGVARAGAIVVGLAITTAGYVVGVLAARRPGGEAPPGSPDGAR